MNLQEYLRGRRLITDGAMGTYYEKKYGDTVLFPEEENLLHPDRIRDIHLEYLHAGARLLRTNTFATDPVFVPDVKKRLDGLRAGYAIAETAVDKFREDTGCAEDIYIAADFGPIGELEEQSTAEVLDDYRQMCDVFLDCGATVFVFESQRDDKYVKQLADHVKARCPEAFVLVQFTFDKSGYTRAGLSVRRINESMAAPDADSIDAYGYNCGVEAGHLLQLLQSQPPYCRKFFSALPNAGYPLSLRGRTIYTENEQYFVKKSVEIAALGVDIIGGCCGTTPGYIRDLKQALEGVTRGSRQVVSVPAAHLQKLSGDDGKPLQSDAFMDKLKNGKKPVIVEMDPPFNGDISKVLAGAGKLAAAGADLLTLSDSPMARARMDAGALAAKLIREVGIPVMPHIACRDRNIIGLRGMLMGDHMNDIRQLLIVTGDPVARDARGSISGVFDMNSIRLMEYVTHMNEELYPDDPLHFGGALNYHGANPDAIIRRMEKKIEAGCEYFLTQPIYSDEDVERIAYIQKALEGRTKICCGIMPLVSYKNAMFLHNEMAGIHIPEEILAKYDPDMTREAAQAVAVEISLELAGKLSDIADAYYFMTPFNRADLICEIIAGLK
ncbi:MAG: bifunctional homocysteine S-methyltransferase/methylenetetrahydrofolate reductase [bacterium]|nr:bifunctional homocysteine S-methyltransferase/methylenetetrahydrofolate reductase [bacterium]MDY4098645.1 bifunctional homocysteine S-methyltransferase/methylenetetrahydrofolate reductase [Lachnospiraceae bacterium]